MRTLWKWEGIFSLRDPIEAIETTSDQYLIMYLFWLLSPPFLLFVSWRCTDRLNLLRLGQDGWADYSAGLPAPPLVSLLDHRWR